jgi:hypothetical protein
MDCPMAPNCGLRGQFHFRGFHRENCDSPRERLRRIVHMVLDKFTRIGIPVIFTSFTPIVSGFMRH